MGDTGPERLRHLNLVTEPGGPRGFGHAAPPAPRTPSCLKGQGLSVTYPLGTNSFLWVGQPLPPTPQTHGPRSWPPVSPSTPTSASSLSLSLRVQRGLVSIPLPVSAPSGLRLRDPEHSTEPGCSQGL